MDKMSEFVVPRGSGRSSISYMICLHKLYTSGKISRIDYYTMRAAALVFLFGVPEEDVLKQIEKELSDQ